MKHVRAVGTLFLLAILALGIHALPALATSSMSASYGEVLLVRSLGDGADHSLVAYHNGRTDANKHPPFVNFGAYCAPAETDTAVSLSGGDGVWEGTITDNAGNTATVTVSYEGNGVALTVDHGVLSPGYPCESPQEPAPEPEPESEPVCYIEWFCW